MIRRHVRSNVIGYVALFVALSGTAYATHPGGANTISSIDIINGEVRSADIASGNVQNSELGGSAVTGGKIAPGTVQGSDVQNDDLTGTDVLNNSLTGDDVAEGTLNLAAEGFHVVGSPGEPTFQTCHSGAPLSWQAHGSSTPAFFRDAAGVVHLQGNARCNVGSFFVDSPTIFFLPAGYRPAAFQNHLVIEGNATNTNVVTISDTTGAVTLADLAQNPVQGDFITFDGITFRCGPSGANGCP